MPKAKLTPSTESPITPQFDLSDQQRLFCEFYAANLNATQAAIKAGYSEKTAYSQGARLLKHVEAKRYVSYLLELRTMGAAEVLARLSQQAFFDIGDITDDEGNIDFVKARKHGLTHLIKSIERRMTPNGIQWKYELYDSQAALLHLGRAYSMFTDKQDVTGDITIKVVRGNANDPA